MPRIVHVLFLLLLASGLAGAPRMANADSLQMRMTHSMSMPQDHAAMMAAAEYGHHGERHKPDGKAAKCAIWCATALTWIAPEPAPRIERRAGHSPEISSRLADPEGQSIGPALDPPITSLT